MPFPRWCWVAFSNMSDSYYYCICNSRQPRLDVSEEIFFSLLRILHLNNKNYQVECDVWRSAGGRKEWGNKRAAYSRWKGKSASISLLLLRHFVWTLLIRLRFFFFSLDVCSTLTMSYDALIIPPPNLLEVFTLVTGRFRDKASHAMSESNFLMTSLNRKWR